MFGCQVISSDSWKIAQIEPFLSQKINLWKGTVRTIFQEGMQDIEGFLGDLLGEKLSLPDVLLMPRGRLISSLTISYQPLTNLLKFYKF